jgi:hypothetical protein
MATAAPNNSDQYTINEDVFKRNDPVNFKAYAELKKKLYDEAVGPDGRASQTSAQSISETIARRQFYAAAVKAGAAADPNNPTAETVPIPANTKQKPISNAQAKKLKAPPTPSPELANELAQGQRNLAKPVTPAVPEKIKPKKATKSNTEFNDNVLHKYTNYTYKLSLFTLKNSEFNKLVVDPYSKVSKSLILSSGGTNSKERAKEFREDFYFEDLNLSTLIGLNSRSRETNAIDLSFTIFEPNGCTLIDRLIALTEVIAGKGTDNYLVMPYILQIDFLGYNAEGTPVIIPKITKTIPLTLIEMKIKPDLAGTRYTVRAVPLNHLALTNTAGVIPTNCEVTAQKVAVLFKSTGATGADKAAEQFGGIANNAIAIRERAETDASAAMRNDMTEYPQDVGNQAREKALNEARELIKAPVNASSLADVLNGWNKFLVKEKIIGVADEYDIEFDDKIGDADVVLPQLNPAQDVPTSSTKGNNDPTQRALQNSIARGIAQSASGTGVYRIFAGSAITNIIAQVVRHSSYIRDQIKEEKSIRDQAVDAGKKAATDAAINIGAAAVGVPAPVATIAVNAVANSGRENQQNEPTEEEILQWFKIIPRVELLEFDKIRNQYAKKIVFRVEPYKSPNPRYPFAPQGVAKAHVKNYHYWYTGKNTDILNVEIAFDTAFYTAVSLPLTTSFNEVNSNVSGTTDSPADAQAIQERQARLKKTGLPFPVIQNPAKQLGDMVAFSKTVDKKSMAVEDLTESLMSRNRGDMTTIKMEIIGDPEFIKQDGLFGERVDNSKKKTENESLITDYERIIVNFSFKYPKDWTHEEGLLKPNRQTVFEGLYAITKVDSTFERGNFKQSIEMYRLHETKYAPENKPAASSLTASAAGTVRNNITGAIVPAP